jgi:hypothetical protein
MVSLVSKQEMHISVSEPVYKLFSEKVFEHPNCKKNGNKN